MSQLQTMMSTAGDGPVNWTLATNIARQTVAAAGDSSVGAADRRAVEETLRLADLLARPGHDPELGRRAGADLEPGRVGRGHPAGVAAAGRAGRRERGHRDGRRS